VRFIVEHPWASGCIFGSISFVLIWTGIRDEKTLRIKIGLVVVLLAISAMIIGDIFSTPREHATRVVNNFIKAVMQQNIQDVRKLVSPNVIVVDDLGGRMQGTGNGVVQAVKYLHEKYPPTNNTILRFEVFERENDALVEVAMMSRITSVGSVPHSWRLIVTPNDQDTWLITTIDVVEVAFRSYR